MLLGVPNLTAMPSDTAPFRSMGTLYHFHRLLSVVHSVSPWMCSMWS